MNTSPIYDTKCFNSIAENFPDFFLSNVLKASNNSSSLSTLTYFLATSAINSGRSMVPESSLSTSAIHSINSLYVGFIFIALTINGNSSILTNPSESLSKKVKASLYSAIYSSVNYSPMI